MKESHVGRPLDDNFSFFQSVFNDQTPCLR